MKKNVESWTQKGNTCFLAGNHTQAIPYYYNALRESGALKLVTNYVQKNQDNLQEDQETLRELLKQKYHITLINGALPVLLISIQKQLAHIENEHACQLLKKKILSKNPKTLEQYIDALVEHSESPSWPEIGCVSQLLQEHGFNYDECDVSKLCYDRQRAQEIRRLEHSLLETKPDRFSDIDTMTGPEFEEFLEDFFIKSGYHVERRKRSHDQGLDLLLVRQGESTAVQAKRYSKPVGNNAVREAIAAREYYPCTKALVVTNSRFTTSAQQLAERCKVELWDRKILKEKIKKTL